MSGETEELRDIFLDVAGEEPLTERQEADVSRDPIDEETAELEAEVSGIAREDGLTDAVDVEFEGGDPASN